MTGIRTDTRSPPLDCNATLHGWVRMTVGAAEIVAGGVQRFGLPERVMDRGIKARSRLVEFDEYVAARGQQLVRLGYFLSGDYHTAEDLAQTALTNAYRHWRRIQRKGDPHPYVRRTLVNAHLSLRGRARLETPVATADGGRAEPDPAVLVAEQDAVLRALAQVTARERAVLVLRNYEDLDHAAIAAALGIAESTARATASRALASLRSLYDTTPAKGAVDERHGS